MFKVKQFLLLLYRSNLLPVFSFRKSSKKKKRKQKPNQSVKRKEKKKTLDLNRILVLMSRTKQRLCLYILDINA